MIFGFLTLKSISFLKNKVSLNDYFFLIQQVISQSVIGLTSAVTENSYRAQNAISLIEEVDAGTIGIFLINRTVGRIDAWSKKEGKMERLECFQFYS